jgi:hypothetical protein
LLGILAQLTKGCEESKIMMKKTMMEVKLDGSNKFKFLEDKTSKEDLLWVIQKGVTVTYLLHEDIKRKNISQEPLAKSYQHPQVCTCIYIICIIFMREIAGRRNLFLKSWIQRDLSAFRGSTHAR